MKKVLVIYNLAAGRRRRSRLLPTIKKNLKRSKYQLYFKNFENFLNVKPLAKDYKYDLIIIAGGDGTIRRVAEFILKNKLNIPIGILPTGSANVLAQSLYIPRSLHQALEVINEGNIEYIDVGLINKRDYFLEAFAIGYLSERVVAAEQKLKRSFGFMAYLMSFLWKTRMPQYNFSFTVDGQDYQRQGNSLFVVNTSRLFGFEPKRNSDLQDGKFELTVATNKNFFSFIEATYYYYFHDSPPRHLSIIEGRHFVIRLETDDKVQVDGDYLEDNQKSLNIEIIKQALPIIPNRHVKN